MSDQSHREVKDTSQLLEQIVQERGILQVPKIKGEKDESCCVEDKINCIFQLKPTGQPSKKMGRNVELLAVDLLHENFNKDLKWTITLKFDGECCFFFDHKVWRKYDAKQGRTPPKEWRPTVSKAAENGHFIGFVPLTLSDPGNKWYADAFNSDKTKVRVLHQNPDFSWEYTWEDFSKMQGTFEILGPKFQGNPHQLTQHCVMRHGSIRPKHPPASFQLDQLKDWFNTNEDGGVEGIVLHGENNQMFKLTRHHLGLPWPPSTVLNRIPKESEN